jgi:hypothetical protein
MGTSRVSTIAEEDAKRVPEDEFLKTARLVLNLAGGSRIRTVGTA